MDDGRDASRRRQRPVTYSSRSDGPNVSKVKSTRLATSEAPLHLEADGATVGWSLDLRGAKRAAYRPVVAERRIFLERRDCHILESFDPRFRNETIVDVKWPIATREKVMRRYAFPAVVRRSVSMERT